MRAWRGDAVYPHWRQTSVCYRSKARKKGGGPREALDNGRDPEVCPGGAWRRMLLNYLRAPRRKRLLMKKKNRSRKKKDQLRHMRSRSTTKRRRKKRKKEGKRDQHAAQDIP